MGWGTFIAGQVIGSVRRARNKPLSESDERFLNQVRNTPVYHTSPKDNELMWLCALGGILGAHRYRTKKYLTGLIFTFTFGGGLIFWVIDLFKIASGRFKYEDGFTGREKNPSNLKLPKYDF
jgi:TM2 domain-containing membrane protein YozV